MLMETLCVSESFSVSRKLSEGWNRRLSSYFYSSDLSGPAECLFQEEYFNLMRTALKPNGIICSQAGTAWGNLDHVAQTMKHCRSAFNVVEYGIAAVPTYPTGQIGFVLGSTNDVI